MKIFVKKLAAVLFGCLFSFPVFAEVYKAKATVSYYAEAFNGKKTSNGEIFDMNKLTCASKNMPFNTQLKVTNLKNGKSVVVRVNDRGPFVVGRELDLSKAAAKQLDMIGTGTATVRIEVIKLGADTKVSRQTAQAAAKLMAKKGEKITYYTGPSYAAKSYDKDKLYDFQLAAFSNKDNAKQYASKLSKNGFSSIVLQTTKDGVVRVVIKAVKGDEVLQMAKKLEAKDYSGFQIKERKA